MTGEPGNPASGCVTVATPSLAGDVSAGIAGCAEGRGSFGSSASVACQTQSMPAAAVITPTSPAQAKALIDSICDLYDEVFSAAPFLWTDEESGHHRNMLVSLLDEPTFGVVRAEAGGQLVGFAYGYTLPVDTRWWQGFQEPPPAELTRERVGRTFALIDLAVQREWRGQGIGRQLVSTLLEGRSEERATLCVQPTAADAQVFYDRLGWRRVGRKDMPPGAVSPTFDVYVVELGNKR